MCGQTGSTRWFCCTLYTRLCHAHTRAALRSPACCTVLRAPYLHGRHFHAPGAEQPSRFCSCAAARDRHLVSPHARACGFACAVSVYLRTTPCCCQLVMIHAFCRNTHSVWVYRGYGSARTCALRRRARFCGSALRDRPAYTHLFRHSPKTLVIVLRTVSCLPFHQHVRVSNYALVSP